MSEYRNFVIDFPKRCRDILDFTYNQAAVHDREVTLLLMTAAAAFIVPFERLRKGNKTMHPSKDEENFPKLSIQLNNTLSQSFISSPFWNSNPDSWVFGKTTSVEGNPDQWPDFHKKHSITKANQGSQVLACIRNALAHGNLYISGSKNQIKNIVFVSEDIVQGDKKGYKFISVSPQNFHEFLQNWFTFLEKSRIPQDEVLLVLEEMA